MSANNFKLIFDGAVGALTLGIFFQYTTNKTEAGDHNDEDELADTASVGGFFSAKFTWDGERRHKASMVDACKQSHIGKKMSSNRLDRVQEAARQLQANKAAAVALDTDSAAAETLGAAGSIQIERQVIENGSDLAFAMEEGGELTLWIGRVEIMLGRNKSPLRTVMFLEDAKVDCVRFVCTCFQQIGD
jgi:type III secretion system FlhB-like substrate exporter